MATSSSYSSPLVAASIALTAGMHGSASASSSSDTPLARARCPASPRSPSLMSMAACAPWSASHLASRSLGWGIANRIRCSAAGMSPRNSARSAAPGPPSRPVTKMMSPGSAPDRRRGRAECPSTVIVSDNASDAVILPPTIGHCAAVATAPTPRARAATSPRQRSGNASASNSPLGMAAIAARSLNAAAAARAPISSALSHSRLKCTCSTDASMLTTRRSPAGMSSIAASSPMPCAREPHSARSRRIMSNSAPLPIATCDESVTPPP